MQASHSSPSARAKEPRAEARAQGPLFARGRLKEASKWFWVLGWDVLPQGRRGQRILRWGADHAYLASPTNPKRSVRRWCRSKAPYLKDAELDAIVAATETSNKRWTPDQCAVVLGISVRDRETLGFRFIGADDDENYEARDAINRAKAAARARRYRAAHGAGAKKPGRPALQLSAEDKLARSKAQDAARARRCRAGKSSGTKRGRPKSEIPAWQAAGFKSKQTYQRHKARGTVDPQSGTKNAVTEKSVTRHKNR
jgi:hypothetical protein